MKNGIIESDQNGNLRRQAEERLKDGRSDPASSKGEGKDALALVHELQVHQIELEMQNEELKLSKLETEDALVKYSDLYDFAPIGLFAFDAEGLIQEVNLAGAKLLGVERRNLMNRHFQLFVAPKDRHFFDDFCKKAFETSIKQTCELNLLRDGKPAVHARIEGIAAEDGPLNGRQCRIAAIDITERKQAEKALQQSEQRYRNLFESMDEGFALCEMIYDEAGKPVDFRYLNVNPSFARLTGLSEQVAGKTVRELIPGIEPFWVETYGRVVQSGLSERIDNSVAALGRHYEVYVWRSGIGRFAAIFNDITERKRMENELSETRDYLENLINHANAPIIVWDAFSRITRFNHAFERLTGLRATEALGEPLSILFPENSQEESLDYIGRTLSGERWDAVEIPILGTDGSVRTVLWNSANIYGKDGITVVSTIAQGQDITERKWMEEELRKARDELERRVQERIAELSKAKENLEVINEKLQVEITSMSSLRRS